MGHLPWGVWTCTHKVIHWSSARNFIFRVLDYRDWSRPRNYFNSEIFPIYGISTFTIMSSSYLILYSFGYTIPASFLLFFFLGFQLGVARLCMLTFLPTILCFYSSYYSMHLLFSIMLTWISHLCLVTHGNTWPGYEARLHLALSPFSCSGCILAVLKAVCSPLETIFLL